MLVAGGRVCTKLFENIYFFEFDLDNCCGLKSLLVSSFIFILFTENYILGEDFIGCIYLHLCFREMAVVYLLI